MRPLSDQHSEHLAVDLTELLVTAGVEAVELVFIQAEHGRSVTWMLRMR
tara:strand:- start:383 stop:529 length:147 start_codon:yes stop_codon:yes gene_type:complete